MHRTVGHACLLALSAIAVCVVAPPSDAQISGRSIQPGIFLFDQTHLEVSEMRSGGLCADEENRGEVCDVGTRFVVAPKDTCQLDNLGPVPCLRYGYRFDYSGTTPGTMIECRATRKDGFNRQQESYAINLEAESGSFSREEWVPFDPVEKRSLVSELHECTINGEPLASIEYIIVSEPPTELAIFNSGAAGTEIEEARSLGVPNACNYLDQDLASLWVGATAELEIRGAEHIPDLRSMCSYAHIRNPAKVARIEHKYHVYELFDVGNLNIMQLSFNAAFAAGGHEPTAIWRDFGKVTFVFELPPDRSQIMVVTDIQGPPGGDGRPRQLLGHYHLRNVDKTHLQRLECLKVLATESLDQWRSTPPDANNTVSLPQRPDPPIRTCIE